MPTETTVTSYAWNEVTREILSPTISRRVVNGDGVTLARVSLAAGCRVPLHAHENEQITWVLSGALRFKVGPAAESVIDVPAGSALRVPSNVPHAVEADVDTEVLDVFCPRREDWIRGDDAYLRG